LKTIDKNELIHAVKAIAEGKEYFTSDVTKALVHPEHKAPALNASPLLQTLSAREKEIVGLLTAGLSNKEIGEKLSISHRTADTHRTNIMKKLNVNNVAGVIRFAFENGLA
jgi:DNA-binding NarL/FixJ family response regulator